MILKKKNIFLFILFLIFIILFIFKNKFSFEYFQSIPTIKNPTNRYYIKPDTCLSRTYLFPQNATWWNPSSFDYNNKHVNIDFNICRLKTSVQELPDLDCSVCEACGLLIDNKKTKHCVPANIKTSLPLDPKLRELYLNNQDEYIWVYQNKIYSKEKPFLMTIS